MAADEQDADRGSPKHSFLIDHTWDNLRARQDEVATVSVEVRRQTFFVEVEAPWHGDPLPPAPPGFTEGLWEHEVVELFLSNGEQRYFELELGPHGHYLALLFDGVRRRVGALTDVSTTVQRCGTRWRATARMPVSVLGFQVVRGNAYSLHGVGAQRRYLAAHPPGGSRPDFHCLGSFVALGTA